MMLEGQREGNAEAKAENRLVSLEPRGGKLFKRGRTVTDIAAAPSIGRGSVYRAL
jgi:hypothetical protein